MPGTCCDAWKAWCPTMRAWAEGHVCGATSAWFSMDVLWCRFKRLHSALQYIYMITYTHCIYICIYIYILNLTPAKNLVISGTRPPSFFRWNEKISDHQNLARWFCWGQADGISAGCFRWCGWCLRRCQSFDWEARRWRATDRRAAGGEPIKLPWRFKIFEKESGDFCES